MLMMKGARFNGWSCVLVLPYALSVWLKWVMKKHHKAKKKSSGICLSYRISNTRNEFVLEFLIDKDPGLGLVVMNEPHLHAYLLQRNWCVERWIQPSGSLGDIWTGNYCGNKMNLSSDNTYCMSLPGILTADSGSPWCFR